MTHDHDLAPDQEPAPDPQQALRRERIRELNDRFRKTFSGGTVIITQGVAALPPLERIAVLIAVQNHAAFTEDNDPYGEHDYGSVRRGGQTFCWKIDYYDAALEGGSPDPADPEVTIRVLTVMLAEEY